MVTIESTKTETKTKTKSDKEFKFNFFNSLKEAKNSLINWANFDEKRQRGSLAGKVFTGAYALLLGGVRNEGKL